MNQRAFIFCVVLYAALLIQPVFAAAAPSEFANFETPTVHGMDLSPSGKLLAVCNLPDGRVELFTTANNRLRAAGSIRVGIDPVSVRFRTEDELWVVNQISQSINVLDAKALQIKAIIQTSPRPTDVIFAGTKAFIAGSFLNQIEVIDALTFQQLTNIPIAGQRPTALALSADGQQVYCTIKESGNNTTILARRLTPLHQPSLPGAVEDKAGPYGGQNPPPNSGAEFDPPLNPALGTNSMPPVSLIVKKNAAGRWFDDNNGDWTEYVSGTNAHLSGRIEGWDMQDHDLAMIHATTFSVSYFDSLMTICLALGVHPKTGDALVVGTEHLNHIRFEPRLKGVFAKVMAGSVNPASKTSRLLDLNPHLDYQTSSIPELQRVQSIGDPRAVVWRADGTRCYIAGRGSDNILVLDAKGDRVGGPIAVREGPEALVINENSGQLYSLNRFDGSISVINLENHSITQTVRLFDPTPAEIKQGRRHLYNTHTTSGLGHLACATCHVDARFDRLAWDLGNPAGEMKKLTAEQKARTTSLKPLPAEFHPMKGPMLTQSMQDLIGHEPLHWRGDRSAIEEFGPTFPDLLGADDELTVGEMKEMKEFLRTIMFPPPPMFPLTREQSTNMPLPGFFALGRGDLPKGAPLPNGNRFRIQTGLCRTCHATPSGLGEVPLGTGGLTDTNGNRVLRSALLERAEDMVLKVPGFRNLAERTGFSLDTTNSTAGFGYLHDGRVDTLERLVQDGSDDVPTPKFRSDQELADAIAFLLTAASSRTPEQHSIPTYGGDPIVGRQFSLTSSNTAPLLFEFRRGMRLNSEIEIVVQGVLDDAARSWAFTRSDSVFRSDLAEQTLSTNALEALASTNSSLIMMPVVLGTSARIALDRDLDGYFDGDERFAGFDPGDPSSLPFHVKLEKVSGTSEGVRFTWPTVPGEIYHLESTSSITTQQGWTSVHESRATDATMSHVEPLTTSAPSRYFRVIRVNPE